LTGNYSSKSLPGLESQNPWLKIKITITITITIGLEKDNVRNTVGVNNQDIDALLFLAVIQPTMAPETLITP
jgi:hypothetical protein